MKEFATFFLIVLGFVASVGLWLGTTAVPVLLVLWLVGLVKFSTLAAAFFATLGALVLYFGSLLAAASLQD